MRQASGVEPIWAWIAVVILLPACVSNELRSMEDAGSALEHCELEHSVSHSECETLRATYLEAQRRYEETARLRWSCDPQSEECPTR